MYTVNDLPSWYDHWKTGGYGEDDRETEEEEETVHCDICGKEIYACEGFEVDEEYWCEDCYCVDTSPEILDEELEEFGNDT
jgi:hypothetical protein